jgi:hypothetical protein
MQTAECEMQTAEPSGTHSAVLVAALLLVSFIEPCAT